MQPAEFRLLIHHHDIAYLDESGVIWLSAVIGRWVDALAEHFGEIGLLLYQSNDRLPKQHTPVVRENVRLYSLGSPGKVWDRIPRMRRLRRVCAKAGQEMDGLLVRGITPRQHSVWRFTPVPRKAFLLVGSLSRNWKLLIGSPIGVYSYLMSFYRLWELSWIANDNALLMANSQVQVSQIERSFDQQAHFVPTNSIRRNEFAPLQVRAVSPTWGLLFCGRLDLKKGIRELMQAVAVLSQQGHPCQLDVVGPMTESIHSQLVELAGELGIAAQIRWHGLVPYGQGLFKFYQQADALVLPTYSEGFPHVIWEAAANCCPVVTTAVGGIPALWKHEKHGLLIPPKNVDAIVAALQRLFSDNALRHRLVEQAYEHASAFTVEACAQKLAETLAEEWN